MQLFCASLAAALVATVAGHGAMITPAPRSSHGQKYDAANKCDCRQTGKCYSNITGDAQYCGVGCIGEACLYYQIGCFAGCGTCSYTGKDLYPTAEDLELAGNCNPIAPTLPEEMRSYNRDDLSVNGDWTKVNPWRAPGTAGRGNSKFQPCGVNSGWLTNKPGRGSAGPGAGGQPVGANGTDLPPVGQPAVWHAGGVADVEFSIYANHGGGYSYRLCPSNDPRVSPTEECFQGGALDFATDTTTITYYDGSRAPFDIPAMTTGVGTFPAGSQWRRNPVPMCNCDQGAYCRGQTPAAAADATAPAGDSDKCMALLEQDCASTRKQGAMTCDKCLKANWESLETAGCSVAEAVGYCKGTGPAPPSPSPPPPSPGPKPGVQFVPYPKTYQPSGVTSRSCPTGLMFNASWPDGVGSGPSPSGYGHMPYSMTDKVKVPSKPGRYTLSWRWDCEQTPQVWNSCADIVIV